MRIAIDGQWITEQPSGIGRVTLAWIEALSELDAANEYVLISRGKRNGQLADVLTRNENITHLVAPAIESKLEPVGLKSVLWDQFWLPRVLDSKSFDLVHFLWFGIPISRCDGAVLTIYDADNLVHPERYSLKFRLYYNNLLRYAVPRASAIVTISESSRNDILWCLKTEAEKVHVVYLGVDEGFSVQDRRQAAHRVAEKFGIAGSFLLYTGGIGIRKNLRRLVEAYGHLLRGEGIAEDLVITGAENELASELRTDVGRLGLASRVHFVGYVARDDLVDLYNAAVALVYPSLYEGFGLPLLEAMACGTPIITSRVSSMPEIAGDAAILVDPESEEDIAKAMLLVVKDEELRARLRDLGLRRATHFSWRKSASKLLDVYEQSYRYRSHPSLQRRSMDRRNAR